MTGKGGGQRLDEHRKRASVMVIRGSLRRFCRARSSLSVHSSPVLGTEGFADTRNATAGWYGSSPIKRMELIVIDMPDSLRFGMRIRPV